MSKDKEPLTDDEIFELLHRASLMFSDLVVMTPLGQDIVTVMLRNLDILQKAMIIVREGSQMPPAHPNDDE